MSVSRRLRFEILRRDSYTCRYCGGTAPDVKLTVDHVIPVALGGSDEPANLVTACGPCNGGKASIAPDSPIVEDVDATALLFAKAIDRVAEKRKAEMADAQAAVDFFYDHWNFSSPNCGELPEDFPETITRFLASGLSLEDLTHFASVTLRKTRIPTSKLFRYFCGCCWTEISTRQELARQLIEDGEV